MSRNAESRFSVNPTNIDIQRSRFDRSSSVKFSFNTGVLVPFFVDEVLPGDTHQIKTNKVVRLQTPITPFMDNMYLDTYYFFVPNRLVWSHWKEFNGENTNGPWYPSVSRTVPQIKFSSNAASVGSVFDYMGVPTGITSQTFSINALPVRAYYLIWNEWFRDENLQYPVVINTGDTDAIAGSNTNIPMNGSSAYGIYPGNPMMVSKYHDYFTSSLPAPQKGPDVQLDLIQAGSMNIISDGPMLFADANGDASQLYLGTGSDPYPAVFAGQIPAPSGDKTVVEYDSGLVVDTTGVAAVTINQLRTAFQLQKLYEKDARGGTRYTEILKSHFGVTSPDSRLQRPEYLGGSRIPINVNQVVQSSESASTPQGHTAAYSLTVDSHGDFIQSFTEHGFIIGLCCVRYDHTYQQGLERFWSRKTRFDYYWPVFANIGEQAVLNKEIMATGTSTDEEVFGYQEAWADYRYKPSRVAGEMRSGIANSLDVWHLADNYSSVPSLSAGWIVEDKSNVDRVLAVSSSVSNQLFADFYIQNRTTRPMPMYSIPGLIDHH